MLRELETFVNFAILTPLQDERITRIPLEAVAKLLDEPNRYESNKDDGDAPLIISELVDDERLWAEAVIKVAVPLLEKAAPPPALTQVLSKLAQRYPTSSLVPELEPAITRCLKHTVDFGKARDMRKLLQVFIAALHQIDDGEQAIRDYIWSVRGPGSDCPHPRVLPNLVTTCLAAISHR